MPGQGAEKEAKVKKTLMMTAGLMLGTAGIAQSDMSSTSQGWSSSGGYPACSRTVTDRCIQLYERGVRSSANLAMNRSMAAGTGGPYEAAPQANMSHSTMDHSAATMNHQTGMGGPVEERTGYPPCDPGPGDDRCIQLYERGVSGAGN